MWHRIGVQANNNCYLTKHLMVIYVFEPLGIICTCTRWKYMHRSKSYFNLL